MKKSVLWLAAGLLAGAGVAEAATLQPGAWKFYYYSATSPAKSYTRSLCIKADHTWGVLIGTGPFIPGAGGWAQDGNDISFYGTVGEAIIGPANSAVGRWIDAKLITGQYIDFNIAAPAPNGDRGIFKANFVGACPQP